MFGLFQGDDKIDAGELDEIKKLIESHKQAGA